MYNSFCRIQTTFRFRNAKDARVFDSIRFASTAEFVGDVRLRELSEVVVESVFQRVFSSKAEGSAGRQFDLQIHSLDGAGRNLSSRLEPVEDQLGVTIQRLGQFLHRFSSEGQ